MNPWISDAKDQHLDFEDITQLENFIVITPAVREFLNTGRGDRKYFLAAPKGMGKTLLLMASMPFYKFVDNRAETIDMEAAAHLKKALRFTPRKDMRSLSPMLGAISNLPTSYL